MSALAAGRGSNPKYLIGFHGGREKALKKSIYECQKSRISSSVAARRLLYGIYERES